MIKIKNIEITEEELCRIIKENPQVMTENKSKFFTPKEDERYFFLTSTEFESREKDSPRDTLRILRGVYRTEAEAIQADNVRLAIKRVWDSADSKWFFRPDWNDKTQTKYFPIYDHEYNRFTSGNSNIMQANPFLPCFKTEADRDAFAKENEKDLRVIWGI
jgi:hypothetical protein